MKAVYFSLFAILAASPVLAADMEKTYTELSGLHCHKFWPKPLSASDAKDAAKEASDGGLDPYAFSRAFVASCDIGISKEVGRGVASGTMNLDWFTDLANLPCDGSGKALSGAQALQVVKGFSTRSLDRFAFRDAFRRTCDFTNSMEAAKGTIAHMTVADAFSRLAGFHCDTQYGTLGNDKALTVAQGVVAKEVDLYAFSDAYFRSCDYATSLEVGKGVAAKTVSGDAFNRLIGFRCDTGYSPINKEDALRLAKRIQGKHVNLLGFSEAYHKGCNVAQAEKAAAIGAASSDSDEGATPSGSAAHDAR